MAKVYGYWWGGHSYANDESDEYLEVFDSTRAAMVALDSRNRFGYSSRQTFNYADGRTEHHYCPVVDKESTIKLYLYDPREGDNGPDRKIYFGPRGGVRMRYLR